jgi:hypothetical protein
LSDAFDFGYVAVDCYVWGLVGGFFDFEEVTQCQLLIAFGYGELGYFCYGFSLKSIGV